MMTRAAWNTLGALASLKSAIDDGVDVRLLLPSNSGHRNAPAGGLRVPSAGDDRIDPSPRRRARLLEAADRLDERRFSGAVLSDERVHFARLQVERNIAERASAFERFGDGGR